MPKFKPVKQYRISEEIAEQLKQSILIGEFKAGDKLPSERELSEQFHVSRAAVREALRTLEISGFITTRQGATGGAFVTDLTFQNLSNAFLDLFLANKISISEIYQVRVFFEPEVARLAAKNVTPEYAQRLKEALEAENAPIKSLSEDVDNKTLVHFILAEMCGNHFYESLVKSLMGLTKKIVEVVDPDPRVMHPPGMHRPIVEAVLSGDPEKAAKAMEEHAIEFGKNLFKIEKSYRKKKSAQTL